MDESVSFDPDTYVLVQRFIKWVDSLLESEEETDVVDDSVNLPSYAKSTQRRAKQFNAREKVPKAIRIAYRSNHSYESTESTYDDEKTGLQQSVLERIKLLNKAQHMMKFHDESNPHVANNIYKCNAIEKSINIPRRKIDKQDNHVDNDIAVKNNRSMSEKKSKIITDYLNENEAKKVSINMVENSVQENIYRNKELWSERSVELEDMLKPHILKENLKISWDTERKLFDFHLYSSLLDDLEVGVADTYYVNIFDDINRAWTRSGRDRNVYRLMTNSTFSASDIPSPRLSVSRIYSDFFYFGGKFVLRNESCSYRDIDHSIHSMIDKRLSNNIDDAALLSCFGTLKGITATGNVHVRPLCSVGDVLIALHELLDPDDFLCGCVQLPILLSAHLTRHLQGYYRFIYSSTQPPIWQYLRISDQNVPKVIAPFLCPVLCNSMNAFTIESLETKNIDPMLKSSAAKVISSINRKFCHDRLLSGIVVDFEMSSGRSSQDIDCVTQFYRIINISSAVFSDRVMAPRRHAICGLDFNALDYLNEFHNAFQSQWKQRHHLPANNESFDNVLHEQHPIAGFLEQKNDISGNDFARSGYTPPSTASKRTKEYLLEKASSNATNLIRKILYLLPDDCAYSDSESSVTNAVDAVLHHHNDVEMIAQSNKLALHVFSFLKSEDFVEIFVSHLDELKEPNDIFNSQCVDTELEADDANNLKHSDQMLNTVINDDGVLRDDIELENDTEGVPTYDHDIGDMVNAVGKMVAVDRSRRSGTSALQQSVKIESTSIDKVRPVLDMVKLSSSVIIREVNAVRYLVKHVDSYDTNFDCPSVGDSLSIDAKMQTTTPSIPNIKGDHILSANEKLSAIAYNIAKELSPEELMGKFSINKYFNEDLLKTKVTATDSDDYAKKDLEYLLAEYNSNDPMTADNGQIIVSSAGSTDILFEENSIISTSSKLRTRTWSRRNRINKNKEKNDKNRHFSTKSRKARRKGKPKVKVERDAAFQVECDRIMTLLLDGIDPMLATKIRQGLNKFTAKRSSQKREKKRKKSSLIDYDYLFDEVEAEAHFDVINPNIVNEVKSANYMPEENILRTIFGFLPSYDDSVNYNRTDEECPIHAIDVKDLNNDNIIDFDEKSEVFSTLMVDLQEEIRCQQYSFNDDHLSLGSGCSNDTLLDVNNIISKNLEVMNNPSITGNGIITSKPLSPPRPPMPLSYDNSSSVNEKKVSSVQESLQANNSKNESNYVINDNLDDEDVNDVIHLNQMDICESNERLSENSSYSNCSSGNLECGSDYIYDDNFSSDENHDFQSILSENNLMDKAKDAMLLATSTRKTIKENIFREFKGGSGIQQSRLVFEILMKLESDDVSQNQTNDMDFIAKSLIRKERSSVLRQKDMQQQPFIRPSLSVSAIDSIKHESWNDMGLNTSSETRNPYCNASYTSRFPMRAEPTVRQKASNYIGGGMVDSNGFYLAKRSFANLRRIAGRVHIPTGSKQVSLHGRSNHTHSIHLSESSSESEREYIADKWNVSDHCISGHAILRQAESLLRSHVYHAHNHKNQRAGVNSDESLEYKDHFHHQKNKAINPVDRKFLTAMTIALKTILLDGNMLNKVDKKTESRTHHSDHCGDRIVKTPKLIPPPLRNGNLWDGSMLWQPNILSPLEESNLTVGDCKTIEGVSYINETEMLHNDCESTPHEDSKFSSQLHNSSVTIEPLQSTLSTFASESIDVSASISAATDGLKHYKVDAKKTIKIPKKTSAAKDDQIKTPKGLYIIAQSYKKNSAESTLIKTKGCKLPLKLPILNKSLCIPKTETVAGNSVKLQNIHSSATSRPTSVDYLYRSVFTDTISMSDSNLTISDASVVLSSCVEIVESILMAVCMEVDGKETIAVSEQPETSIITSLPLPRIDKLLISTVKKSSSRVDHSSVCKTSEVFIHVGENNKVQQPLTSRSHSSSHEYLRQLGGPDWHGVQSDRISVDNDIDETRMPLTASLLDGANNNSCGKNTLSKVTTPTATPVSPLTEFLQQNMKSKITITPRRPEEPKEKTLHSIVRPSQAKVRSIAVKPEPPAVISKGISPLKASAHRKLTSILVDTGI